jgi:serine/threonine-protein kinase HipA
VSINPASLPGRVRSLSVSTAQGVAGSLVHDAQYQFTCAVGGEPVALAMPNRAETYNRGALHPIFEMNLPEGYVRRYISERLRRYTRVDDMLFLAIQGNNGVGRLAYDAGLEDEGMVPEALAEILHWGGGKSLFPELLERHLFETTLSGMQPKVAITAESTGKASLVQSAYIVKTSGDDYPQLPLNEYICMRLARAAGLATPDFWLSDDQTLFIMERFDYQQGLALGMEDFCVLMGRSGEERYLGSYENAARVVTTYTHSHSELIRFFDYVMFNCLIGNGDAHLKNFALLYKSPETPPWLSPIYDVVCTQVYPLEESALALKMNKSKQFPDRIGLMHYASVLGIKGAERRLDAMLDDLHEELSRIPELKDFPALEVKLRKHLGHGAAIDGAQPGLKQKYNSRDKHRKFP